MMLVGFSGLDGLSNLGYFRKLRVIRRYESFIGLAAFFGVLAFDVKPGVMIGVFLALLEIAQDIHRPTTAAVGRTPSGAFVDIDQNAEAQEITGMLIWRQYAPLVFLNVREAGWKVVVAALAAAGAEVPPVFESLADAPEFPCVTPIEEKHG